MQGKCYYCNKELTERTIKRHMKNCLEMKKVIEEEIKGVKEVRDQFIISIKDKNNPSVYCIYISIDANLQLHHLDKLIRDIWVECCGHLSTFYIDKEMYHDNSDGQYEMNFYLKDVLNVDKKFEYQYDFGSATNLILEVVDMITVPSKFSQIEIIARNNAEANGSSNSPRDGVCGYVEAKDAELAYLPKNDTKYKVSNKRSLHNNIGNTIMDSDSSEQIMEENFLNHYNKFTNSFIHSFFKGTYSLELEELIKPYPKKQINTLSENIGLKLSSNLNKSDAIEKYVNEYEHFIKNKMNSFNEEIYKILLKYVKNHGIISVSDKETETYADKHAFLMNEGIIFPCLKDNEPIFVMPKVMQNIIKESDTLDFRKLMKKNSEIINIFIGMIKTYGFLYFDDVKSLIRRYIHIEDSILLSILEEGSFYYNNEYYGEMDESGQIVFINGEIEDYEEILSEIDKNLDYVMISKEELISMCQVDYLGKSSIGRKFIKEFSAMFVMDRNEILDTMSMIALDIQYRSSEEILEDIIKEIGLNIDREDEFKLYTVINKFIKNIHLWKNKGSAISEIEGNNTTIINKTNVGRNDPCPCQSGKKYKKCCGKNENVIQLF